MAPRRFHANGYQRPHGWYEHRWVYGEILPSLFWSQNYWLSDYYDYGLSDPPPGLYGCATAAMRCSSIRTPAKFCRSNTTYSTKARPLSRNTKRSGARHRCAFYLF